MLRADVLKGGSRAYLQCYLLHRSQLCCTCGNSWIAAVLSVRVTVGCHEGCSKRLIQSAVSWSSSPTLQTNTPSLQTAQYVDAVTTCLKLANPLSACCAARSRFLRLIPTAVFHRQPKISCEQMPLFPVASVRSTTPCHAWRPGSATLAALRGRQPAPEHGLKRILRGSCSYAWRLC